MRDRIEWMCDAWRKPIEDGKGSVRASFREMREIKEARAAWDKEHPGPIMKEGELTTYPRGAGWMVLHDACTREPEEGYAIEVNRIRDTRALLAWTVHLMEKVWLPETRWEKIIERAAESMGISVSV